MSYDWKITLINGKEYIVKDEASVARDFNNKLFGIGSNGVSPGINLVSYLLSEKDMNKCKDVMIVSTHVVSVEFNFMY